MASNKIAVAQRRAALQDQGNDYKWHCHSLWVRIIAQTPPNHDLWGGLEKEEQGKLDLRSRNANINLLQYSRDLVPAVFRLWNPTIDFAILKNFFLSPGHVWLPEPKVKSWRSQGLHSPVRISPARQSPQWRAWWASISSNGQESQEHRWETWKPEEQLWQLNMSVPLVSSSMFLLNIILCPGVWHQNFPTPSDGCISPQRVTSHIAGSGNDDRWESPQNFLIWKEEEALGQTSPLSSLHPLDAPNLRWILTLCSSGMSFSVKFFSFAVAFKHSWKKLRGEANVRAQSEILLLVLAVKPALGCPKLLFHC